MSPRRLQLEGASLTELKSRVVAQYGPAARIVGVEQVTSGGIKGFFASRHFEITVELPDPPGDPRILDAHVLDLPARFGIAALLDDADQAEVLENSATERAPVSTTSHEFAEILADLATVTAHAELAEAPPAPPVLPAPLNGAGDLVVVVGMRDDALTVTQNMARGREVLTGGALADAGGKRIDDRRTAIVARARGVKAGAPIFLAFGLGAGDGGQVTRATELATALAGVRPDQVWAAVDAGRKPEDTRQWLHAVETMVPLVGLVGVGRESTMTPETLHAFDLPVSWEYDA